MSRNLTVMKESVQDEIEEFITDKEFYEQGGDLEEVIEAMNFTLCDRFPNNQPNIELVPADEVDPGDTYAIIETNVNMVDKDDDTVAPTKLRFAVTFLDDGGED